MNLPVSYRKTSEQALAEATNLEAARIPIEKFSGHGLLFAGDQDAMWPADTAVRELSSRNKNLEGVVYHGAGHLFDEDITHYGPIWPTMFGGSIEGVYPSCNPNPDCDELPTLSIKKFLCSQLTLALFSQLYNRDKLHFLVRSGQLS